ncbi:MAG: NAD(P)-binding domain-containing protein [Alicyclobacillus mali]|uniref:pyrroline-5-carboxylate reductase dimerization domain-containing protein n=1 Tax=Alicyclobacillus mali (ex Roth et al. 2021) TaxID=1123961 RepID=UPI0023EF83A7|nr:pyrroline-5-carboxylate reductase dimerization domain-containing protein [Alicyclobacillus mali (ex Roth et al. 2021)]MCL6488883.1 NAD(P)-binding domain-containing protein [Alicyclobacillus mali (ex Roth et al. 2021)]
MTIGIIGTGHMGGMLAALFAETSGDRVLVFNRTPEKATLVAARHPRIEVAQDLQTIADMCDAVFICTRAPDGEGVVRDIGPRLMPSSLLVTTISTADLAAWRRLTPAAPVKIVPSLTQWAKAGVIVVIYPEATHPDVKRRVERLLAPLGKPFSVPEEQVRLAADLTSCGPAFLARLCLAWSNAAAAVGSMDRAEAAALIRETAIGFARLLETGWSFAEVLDAICVPGGVTEAGLAALAQAESVFADLHRRTARFASGHPDAPPPL